MRFPLAPGMLLMMMEVFKSWALTLRHSSNLSCYWKKFSVVKLKVVLIKDEDITPLLSAFWTSSKTFNSVLSLKRGSLSSIVTSFLWISGWCSLIFCSWYCFHFLQSWLQSPLMLTIQFFFSYYDYDKKYKLQKKEKCVPIFPEVALACRLNKNTWNFILKSSVTFKGETLLAFF